jgi:predicted metal-dependent phosphoesterase TrpH
MFEEAWADLHVHTIYSDGILTPVQVIQKAKSVGLKAVGIVDHDTLDGIPEAIKAGGQYGVEVVPGVELSSQFDNKDVHIIGLFCQLDNPRLNRYLNKFQKERHRRAEKMVRNLENQGVHLTIEEVINKAAGKSLGRPHLAEVLMEKGYVETFQEAFYRFLGYGSPAYEEKYKISPEDAFRLISEAGGLSFLAHPGSSIGIEILLHFVKAGLDGIEIIHPKLSDSQTQKLQEFAKNHELLVCGGSDCHGGRTGDVYIGHYRIPYAILEEIKTALKSK